MSYETKDETKYEYYINIATKPHNQYIYACTKVSHIYRLLSIRIHVVMGFGMSIDDNDNK